MWTDPGSSRLLPSAASSGLIALTAVALTAIAAWGVSQSVAAVALVTLLEVGTLVAIIPLSAESLTAVPHLLSQMAGQWSQLEGAALMTTAFLAFYAFVGFEDMVNMAEEVRNVERTMPLAILISVAITFTLYLGVATVALNLEDRQALAQSNTPMALLLACSFPLVGLAQATFLSFWGCLRWSISRWWWLRLREGAIPWLPGIAAAGCVAMLTLRLVALQG